MRESSVMAFWMPGCFMPKESDTLHITQEARWAHRASLDACEKRKSLLYAGNKAYSKVVQPEA